MTGEASLYSVRMRASRAGVHVSGAERIVPEAEVDAVSAELLRRARGHAPDDVHLTIERVSAAAVTRVPCLPVTTVTAANPTEARQVAEEVLRAAGVSPRAVEAAFNGLRTGLAPGGGPTRGAALMDAATGERREPDLARGVRATHLDYAPEARQSARAALERAGLGHFRTMEALAVASKVIASRVVAELCWSDDRAYVAGYVATARFGYVRFPQFKPARAVGGRVFFVRNRDVDGLIEQLERQCTLVQGPVQVRPDLSPADYASAILV